MRCYVVYEELLCNLVILVCFCNFIPNPRSELKAQLIPMQGPVSALVRIFTLN